MKGHNDEETIKFSNFDAHGKVYNVYTNLFDMAQQPPHKIKELHLPMSRVKTIMKSSPHVESIALDGLFLVTKATEMFIHFMSEEAHRQSNKSGSLDYKHLAEVAQTNETLEFLKEIMPRKITVRQFKQLMAEKEAAERSSSDESSTDSDSDSQSDSESSSDSSKDEVTESGDDKEKSVDNNGKSKESSTSEESDSD